MRVLGIRVVRVLLAVVVVVVLPAAAATAAMGSEPMRQPLGGPAPAIPGVATTAPPLGWNSWNTFGCVSTERQIEAEADALVASGMRAAGYRYVVVDDCWFNPKRDAHGRLQSDPVRFPDGMRALGDYLHARGLKFGIYESPNAKTCTQYLFLYPGATGSLGHERTDAQTFASWGVDYLKYDWCAGNSDLGLQLREFTTMRDALRATGRPIVYSINANSQTVGQPNGFRHDWRGVATVSRTSNDVLWSWWLNPHSVLTPSIGVQQQIAPLGNLAGRSGAGYWDDPDMLVVGVTGVRGSLTPGLTRAEARTQMAMWSMTSAPLMAGNNVALMSDRVRSVLTNPVLLAIDQDPAAAPVARPAPMVWRKSLVDGSIAVALCNTTGTVRTITAAAADLSLPRGSYTITDAWTGTRVPWTGAVTRVVGKHDTAVFRISPTR